MATLQAVVDIQDRASQKFDRMTRSANALWASLDRVDKKMTELERKITLLNRQNIRIRVSLDTMMFDAQYAALRARMAALGNVDFGIGGAPGGRGSLAFADGAVRDTGMGGEAVEATVAPRILQRVRRRAPLRINRLDNGVIGAASVIVSLITRFTSVAAVFDKVFTRAIGGAIGYIIRFTGASGKLSAQLTKLGTVLSGAASVLTAFGAIGAVVVNVATALALVIGVLATAIASLGPPLAGVVTLITGFVGVIGFGIAPLAIWLSQTKKLVDEEKQLEERLSGMTKGTKEYNETLQELNDKRKELQENGGAYIYSELEKFIKEDLKNAAFTPENKQNFVDILTNSLDALRPLLPMVSDMIRMFTDVINSLVQSVGKFTNSTFGQKFLRDLFESALPVVETFGQTLGYLFLWFGKISTAAAPFIDGMLGRFNQFLAGVVDKWSGPGGMNGVTEFFGALMPVFEGLMGIIQDFFGGLGRIGVALAPLTEDLITWIGEFAGEFVDWLIKMVDEFGPDLVYMLQVVGKVIKVVWTGLEIAYRTLRPFIMAIVRVIEFLADISQWFAESPAYAAALAPLRMAFVVIGKIVDGIREALEWIISKLSFLNPFGGAGLQEGVTTTDIFTGQVGGGANPMNPTLRGASGAVVTQPTMALIGESGPEMVAPLHSARGARKLQYGNGGGGISINEVHVHGVQNLDQFISEVKKQVGSAPRISGAGMTIG